MRAPNTPCATCPWTLKGCSPGACKYERARRTDLKADIVDYAVALVLLAFALFWIFG